MSPLFLCIKASPALTVDYCAETGELHLCPTGDPAITIAMDVDMGPRLIQKIEIAIARQLLAETMPGDIVRPTLVLVADNPRTA